MSITTKQGWPLSKLGDVLKLHRRWVALDPSQEYVEIGVRSYGRGIFQKPPVLGASLGNKRVLKICPGDLVFMNVFAWEGAVGVAGTGEEGTIGSHRFATYTPVDDRCDAHFLQLYFQTRPGRELLGKVSPGSAGRNRTMNLAMFREQLLPLPPIEEQRRIVARIEELAAKIEDAKRLRQDTSVAAEVLAIGAMAAVRRNLASKYGTKALGQETKVTAGGTPARDNPSYWGGRIPWIKTGELADSDILGAEEHITDEGLNDSSAKLFPVNTVLIALYGQGQTRGRTGRLLLSATTNQACAAVLPAPEKFEARYVQYWLRSLYREMREDNHGGAQPNWNGQMIKEIQIAVPPLAEQQRIVSYLDSLSAKTESLKQHQAATTAELNALLPSILDKAFKGEL